MVVGGPPRERALLKVSGQDSLKSASLEPRRTALSCALARVLTCVCVVLVSNVKLAGPSRNMAHSTQDPLCSYYYVWHIAAPRNTHILLSRHYTIYIYNNP